MVGIPSKTSQTGARIMTKTNISKMNNLGKRYQQGRGNSVGYQSRNLEFTPKAQTAAPDRLMITFLGELFDELGGTSELFGPSPAFRMVCYLLESHFQAKTVTQTSLIAASSAPYATAIRRIHEMQDAGYIEKRRRTKTGKSFSLHPSNALLDVWAVLSGRIARLTEEWSQLRPNLDEERDYFFGGSYMNAQSIPPLRVLPEPLKLAGGVRVLAHGDPTFMVMENLKRQFENCLGTTIHQRAFSIDRLRKEALQNADLKSSRYDIIAIDLPWIGEFAEKNVLFPLDEIMDIDRLGPADFHTAGWRGAHWNEHPYGVPAQTTPELLFYRKDLFAEAGLEPPRRTDELLNAARHFNNPAQGRHGIAFNAARGTALGHTVAMTFADFGQPIVEMRQIAGSYELDTQPRKPRLMIDTPTGREVAKFLLELLEFSPPDILSMSWYERVRPYAQGKVAMAYGYTLLAPYFEGDATSPAQGQTGYLPHPSAQYATPIAPVGGYVMGIPANLSPERIPAAVEALIAFTSASAQKLYVQNGSRTNPRYSVSSDPEVRKTSTIFEAVDRMSWNDELQFWPRPPIPEVNDIFQICGEEFHDLLRGIRSIDETLKRAQERGEETLKPS